MSVTTGSISAALLGVAGHAHRHWSTDFTVGGLMGGAAGNGRGGRLDAWMGPG
jgi:hypothetical protein